MTSRKCMDGDYGECSEDYSVQSEQQDQGDIILTEDTPWYLRGPKTVYMNYYAISEADLSTESEIDEEKEDDDESSDEDVNSDEEEGNQPTSEVLPETPDDNLPEGASEMTLVEESGTVQEQESDIGEKKDKYAEMSDQDVKDLAKEDSDAQQKGETSAQGDYWKIRKLMKYIKGGDEAATVVATAIVCEHDLTLEGHKNAIIDTGGLEIFLNLLTVENLKCVIGTLKVLKQMVIMPEIGTELVELGIMEDLINLLEQSEEDILSDAVCIIADLSESQLKVRTISRKIGLLPHLVDLIDKIPRNILLENINSLNGSPMVRMEIAMDSMRALAALSRSRGARMVLFECGILHLLPSLLHCKEEDLKSNALLIIMYCASIPIYRKSFEAHNILKAVVSCWKDGSKDEVILRIIYKMAISEEGRNQSLKCKVLRRIITLMKDERIVTRFNLLKYCLASIYRLGMNPRVREHLQELDLIPFLVKNLSHDDESLAVCVSGVLSYLSSNSSNLKKIKDAGCVSVLANIIERKMSTALLSNVDQIIGDLCKDPGLLQEFCSKDAIRHIWSHLAYDSVDLQRAASRALVPLLDGEDSGEEVRNLSGSMDLLIDLLDSKDDQVKASSCEALAKVSKDPENLNILMEMNVVEKINELIPTMNSALKKSLCLLIAGVAEHPEGCYRIGRSRAIENLVSWLLLKFKYLNDVIKSSAVRALWKLSQEPVNAANLYNAGVVPLLIDCLRDGSRIVREPAEGCLYNIRSLAHDTEELLFFGNLKPGKTILGGRGKPIEYVYKFFKEPTLDDD